VSPSIGSRTARSELIFQIFVEDSEIFRRGNVDRRISDIMIGEKVLYCIVIFIDPACYT
jgi:hypothetical protein